MDPSTWMEYTSAAQQAYSHLRTPTNAQINPGSHNHNRNLHHVNHMTSFNNTSCKKNENIVPKANKQMNQLPSAMGVSNHAAGQSLMNGHYNSPNGSSWFFNSHQQHQNHDNASQLRSHHENSNSSFNPNVNPFGIHSHGGVYDSNFMPSPFSQQSKSNYLPMAAASDFINHIKKADSDMNFRSNSYCPTMKGINMTGMSSTCNNTIRDTNLAAGSFFSPHLSSSTNAWHHQNYISQNNQESLNNMISSQNSSLGYNRNSCSVNSMNALSNRISANASKSQHEICHSLNNSSNISTSNSNCNQYKDPPVTHFSNMPLSSNNSYLMQNFPSNRSGQNSYVDPTLGAKFAAAAAHHHVASDPYASFALAAAQEYASIQQQAQKHQQYMSSMNNFASNSNGQCSDYASMTFNSNNFNANRHANELINYCSAPLFPVTPTNSSLDSNLKNHNLLLEDYANNINSNNGTLNNSTKSQSHKSSRKNSNQKINNSKSQAIATNQSRSFNDFLASSSCNTNLLNGNTNSCLVNGSSNINVNSNVSRCSSVASNHQVQISSDPYSYNYSPATTNLSAHSPYQQRSSTSNSSHSSGTSCVMTNGAQDYMNYGTPNSAPPTVFPTMAASQTPTPTPGYPTPPSSVGHSNSRCNSNEELSPFSNNSMSSNISQPYNRNDYKSSGSSSSQISPKQNDTGISDNFQFNSACMVASQKAPISSSNSNQHKPILNSPNMFTSDVLDNSFKSQQYSNNVLYPSQLSDSSQPSSCSDDPYSNFGPENTPIQMSQDSLIPNSINNSVNANEMSPDTTYAYHYPQSHEDQFTQSYSDKSELPSCAQQVAKSSTQSSTNSLIANHIDEGKEEFHPSSQNIASHDGYNLNFDSVIQPIDVSLSNTHDSQQDISRSNCTANLDIDALTSDKSPFPLIDELSFIADSTHQNPSDNCVTASVDEKHENYSISQTLADANHINNQISQCDQIDFQSSHENNSMIENSTSLECNNIQSIIDSLPKPSGECLDSNKSDDSSELLDNLTSSTDNFLSDLAPLMNDNSKIALMESTFKSNDLSTIVHDKDLEISNTSAYSKIDKHIIDGHTVADNGGDGLKLNSSPDINFAKQNTEESQFIDVDDFLKTNFKDSQTSMDIFNKNEMSLTPENVQSEISTKTKEIDAKNLVEDTSIVKPAIVNKSSKKSKSTNSNRRKKVKTLPEKVPETKNLKRKPKDELTSNIPKKRKSIANPVSKKTKETKKSNSIKQQTTSLEKNSEKTEEKKQIIIDDSKQNSKKQVQSVTKVPLLQESKKSTNEISVKLNSSEVKNDKSLSKIKLISTEIPSEYVTCVKIKVDNTANSKNFKELLTVDTGLNSFAETKENVASITNTALSKNSKTSADISPTNKSIVSTKITNEKSQSKSQSQSNKKSETTKTTKTKSVTTNKKPAISPKPCVGNVVSTNSSALLSPGKIINPPCINKPVNSANYNLSSSTNPGLTNVASTLIVNQNPSVNSYQVSPVTNAVLISIHPANAAPISSLTAPSAFITLATQSVTSVTSNTTTTTSGTTQNTSSRRRSQDKKTATIREGLMRTGDFVVAEDESQHELPVIWRIEGKSLLQRFEPSEQNGITVYINTSSYSAWNPTVRQKYIGLDVRIMGCNRTRIVVEKIGLTQIKNIDSSNSSNQKDINSPQTELILSTNILNYLENFEVFIQTLVSQALDSNFISEIVKENDEYFLSHMQTIDEFCSKRRSLFASKVKWDSNIQKCIETFPDIQLRKQKNIGDLRCRLCHDNWSTQILHFEGEPYNIDTLEPFNQVDLKQTKLASCDSCTEKIFIYSKLHHQKYNFYLSCKAKVDEIQALDENKESHIILEECLQDSEWIKMLFKQLESLLLSSDNIR